MSEGIGAGKKARVLGKESEGCGAGKKGRMLGRKACGAGRPLDFTRRV